MAKVEPLTEDEIKRLVADPFWLNSGNIAPLIMAWAVAQAKYEGVEVNEVLDRIGWEGN